MKSLFTLAVVLFTLSAGAHTMKLEGKCSGTLQDGTTVSYTYYSNFDGCKNRSRAAVTFHEGLALDLHTGVRSFSKGKDIYQFKQNKKEVVRLTFADSTGNTSGELTYTDEQGQNQTVQMSCMIRDYSYEDCL
jgi:hypothetical protein